MFTGIITDLGEVIGRETLPQGQGVRVTLASAYEVEEIALGASIACDGVCLTVTEKQPVASGSGSVLSFDLSPETLARSTLGEWQTGTRVNMERSIAAGGEFGGHFVTGHADATGKVTALSEEGDFWRLVIAYPPALAGMIAEKGSVAVNGVSLTVNATAAGEMHLTLIPHTARHTNLGALTMGAKVNLEADLLARYVASLLRERSLAA